MQKRDSVHLYGSGSGKNGQDTRNPAISVYSKMYNLLVYDTCMNNFLRHNGIRMVNLSL